VEEEACAKRRRHNAESTLGFEWVVFFSDAVFAIVITLLVLPLTAEIEAPQHPVDVTHEVCGACGVVSTTDTGASSRQQ